ncbi:hypothetical protein DV096_10395 [Bradymonadaceae bacterium TMQ3]|nr:hypothetical protein DV096_10395 [Bradymonadaceae bacterium TMQ3]TXC75884.1 hypothetical protein FRC91_10300 [Bradymonadales bacterium TMQ1]
MTFFNGRALGTLALVGVLCASPLACSGDDQPAETTERSLSITSPTAGEIVSTSNVRVRGTAENIDQVNVNGEPVDVTGGSWEVLLPFAEGEASVTVSGGGQEDQVDFRVDSLAPQLSLSSPQRATVLDATTTTSVMVNGNVVEEGTGLFLVKVGEQIIDVDEAGNFSYELALTPGLNVVTVTAIDRAGNESATRRGINFGPLGEPDALIEDALRVEVSRTGFERISEVVEAFVTPERIMTFVAGAELPGNVEITDVAFENLDLAITPQDGYFDIAMQLDALRLDGLFSINGNEPLAGYVAIATVGVNLQIELSPREDNSLELRILNSELVLENSDITSNLIEDNDTLRNLVGNLLQVAFAEFVGDLIVESLYDPAILTQNFEFLGRSVELTLGFETLLVTPQGMLVDVSMDFPPDAHADVEDVAGVLMRELGSTGGSNLASPLRMHTNNTALDRALHGVWRSGLFHQVIGGDNLDAIALPFDLTVDGLAALLSDQRIRDLAAPGTPVGLGLRPLLPPVAELVDADEEVGGSIEVGMGDFMIDIFLLHADKPRELVVTIALFINLDVVPTVEADTLKFDLDIEAEGDLADSPLLDLNAARVTGLITELIELIPSLAASNLNVQSGAELEWMRIGDPQIDVHGLQADRLAVGLNLEAASDLDAQVEAGE